MAEYLVPYLLAECPLCEAYGPHFESFDGLFGCAVCNTSFGGAEGYIHYMLVEEGGD